MKPDDIAARMAALPDRKDPVECKEGKVAALARLGDLSLDDARAGLRYMREQGWDLRRVDPAPPVPVEEPEADHSFDHFWFAHRELGIDKVTAVRISSAFKDVPLTDERKREMREGWLQCASCGATVGENENFCDFCPASPVPVVPVGDGPVCQVCGRVIEDGEAARVYGGPGILTVRHSDCPVEDGERSAPFVYTPDEARKVRDLLADPQPLPVDPLPVEDGERVGDDGLRLAVELIDADPCRRVWRHLESVGEREARLCGAGCGRPMPEFSSAAVCDDCRPPAGVQDELRERELADLQMAFAILKDRLGPESPEGYAVLRAIRRLSLLPSVERDGGEEWRAVWLDKVGPEDDPSSVGADAFPRREDAEAQGRQLSCPAGLFSHVERRIVGPWLPVPAQEGEQA